MFDNTWGLIVRLEEYASERSTNLTPIPDWLPCISIEQSPFHLVRGNSLSGDLLQFWKDRAISFLSWKTHKASHVSWRHIKKKIFGQVMFPHHSHQMCQGLKGRFLWYKIKWLSHSVSQSVSGQLKAMYNSVMSIVRAVSHSILLPKIPKMKAGNQKDLRTIPLSCPLHSLPAKLKSAKMSTVGKITCLK